MRIPFLSLFMTSPFEGLQEHAEKTKECAWAFQKAVECYISRKCDDFESLRQEVSRIEQEADAIKRRIRGHLPKGTLMVVDKFQVFRYLREQDNVVDAVKASLEWMSYRVEPGVPEAFEKELYLLAEAIVDPIEELHRMVVEARTYFSNFSEKQRIKVKDIIRLIREKEHEADQLEEAIKRKAFAMDLDPVAVFYMVQLAERIGSIADHAENTGDMMRAMVAR